MNSATGNDWVDDYLARIGAAAGGPGQFNTAAGGPGRSGPVRPVSPDLRVLRDLQHAHLYTVPFENLSIHLGEPIVLDEMALVTKVVRNRRGGFCYELNGAFAALLTALGFRVSRLSARVFGDDGLPSPPFDHMALRVDLAPWPEAQANQTEPWLVDVGFGRFAEQPLRMDFRGDQPDPSGIFRIADSPSGHGDLDVFCDGRPEYRMESRAYSLSDFVPTCWWQQTSPGSHFTQSLTCSILTKPGRVTLSGDRLIVTEGDERSEHKLADDAEILAAYHHYFGITLDRVPVVRQLRQLPQLAGPPVAD